MMSFAPLWKTLKEKNLLRIPLERSSQSALAVRLSVPNGET